MERSEGHPCGHPGEADRGRRQEAVRTAGRGSSRLSPLRPEMGAPEIEFGRILTLYWYCAGATPVLQWHYTGTTLVLILALHWHHAAKTPVQYN